MFFFNMTPYDVRKGACTLNAHAFPWTDIQTRIHTPIDKLSCTPFDRLLLLQNKKTTETYSKWTHTHKHTLGPPSLRRQIFWAVADIMYLACHTDVTAILLRLPESAVKYEWQSLQWIPPSATVSGPFHAHTTPPQWITKINAFTGLLGW